MCPEVRFCLFPIICGLHSLPCTFLVMIFFSETQCTRFELHVLILATKLKFSDINLVPATRHCPFLCQGSLTGLPSGPIPSPCLFEGCPQRHLEPERTLSTVSFSFAPECLLPCLAQLTVVGKLAHDNILYKQRRN